MKIKVNVDNFREFYDLYYDSLYRFLRLYTNDDHMAQDVVQEVFLKLWDNRGDACINHIRAYLFRSARNIMLNRLRDDKFRGRILEEPLDLPGDNNPEDSIDSQYLEESVSRAIDSLPPVCRELFLMSRREGMTYRQIAAAKGISEKTVENQIGIALKKIRDRIFGQDSGGRTI